MPIISKYIPRCNDKFKRRQNIKGNFYVLSIKICNIDADNHEMHIYNGFLIYDFAHPLVAYGNCELVAVFINNIILTFVRAHYMFVQCKLIHGNPVIV